MSGTVVRKLLLVEDDEAVARSLRRWLARNGFEVQTELLAENVDALVRQSPPDVIVADYRMPWLNGLEVLKTIRGHSPQVIRCLISGTIELITPEMLAPVQPVLTFAKPMDLDAFVLGLNNALAERTEKVALPPKGV